jgi:hypothetical protein
MYRQIQFIRVICCFLFLLASDTHDLQLTSEDLYEVKVHIFIYAHTQS